MTAFAAISQRGIMFRSIQPLALHHHMEAFRLLEHLETGDGVMLDTGIRKRKMFDQRIGLFSLRAS